MIGKTRYKLSLDTAIQIIVFSLLIVLFFYGYFIDSSKPISGIGWADQSYYHKVALKIANGDMLLSKDFHYQLNYSLLGSLFYLMGFEQPFAGVSLLLFMGSALLLFYGSRNFFCLWSSILFISFVFFFFNSVRSFDYASKVFMIPWNNQLGFLGVSLYFFIFSYYFKNYEEILKSKNNKVVEYSSKFNKFIFTYGVYIVGFITGFIIGAREELALVLLPLFIYYTYLFKVTLFNIVFSFFIILIAYSPNLYYKYQVFNVFFENVRKTGGNLTYIELLSNYLSPDRLKDNFFGLIINSSHSDVDPAGRLALLQANPWFYLSPIGFIFYIKEITTSPVKRVNSERYIEMILRNGRIAFLIFITLVTLMAIFYLAGENMSIHKLRFHCLRYISFIWIPLSFLTVYLLNIILYKILNLKIKLQQQINLINF